MGGMMGSGTGLVGTVVEVAADHYVVKNDAGQTYTVNFSANTRIMRQISQPRGAGAGGNPPQALKPTDIKVGDAVIAMGETDPAAKTVGAVAVMQVGPRARPPDA